MEAAALRNSVPPGRAVPFFGFVGAVVVLAVLLCAPALAGLPDELPRLPAAFWIMAGLAAACDARPFTPPGHPQSSAVPPSICFTFAILLQWGLGPAVAVQAVAIIVSGWRMRHVVWRTAFNIAQYACALAAADALLRLTPGAPFVGGHPDWLVVGGIVAAAALWFLVTYGLVSLAVRLRFGDPWWPAFRQGLPVELLTTGSLLALAPVLFAAAEISAALIPLVLVPLFAVHRMARLSADQTRLAALDPLTGLPNRTALLAEVDVQLRAHAEQAAKGATDAHLALLLLDLDRFKHVNDALGHAVGDRLLVEVGARLSSVLRPGDVLARLGGDEFAVVATGLTDIDAARRVADEVVAALAEPVSLDGLPLDVGGSIGVAVYPEHGTDFATLMRHADVAMYDAKHRSDTVAVYAAESDHNSPERLGLLADLRRVLEAGAAASSPPAVAVRGGDGAALTGAAGGSGRWSRWLRLRPPVQAAAANPPGGSTGPSDELIARIISSADPIRRRRVGEQAGTPTQERVRPEPGGARTESVGGDPGQITMYYQPQIAIASGEVVGVEALLRWRHPQRGMVDPEELIRVAEQSAVMRLLTRRVVDDVVGQLAAWAASGVTLRAALNVSVRDLHTGEIADQVADLLDRYGVRPDRLQLEITEGALMADPRRVLATISRLHQIGVAIALDDFGTGYSSMQHLRRLPLTEVKVDRSFVLGMVDDADDAAIVRSMIELAGALGLRVVAEGVEDERTWRLLHAAGCDIAQGWFYARPMPADELLAWLARYRPVRPMPSVGRERHPCGGG